MNGFRNYSTAFAPLLKVCTVCLFPGVISVKLQARVTRGNPFTK